MSDTFSAAQLAIGKARRSRRVSCARGAPCPCCVPARLSLFFLAQKAANKQAQDVISNAVANDPDRSVKEKAVLVLKQLPDAQHVPLPIGVAKDHPEPAARKKAMFWLGQSKDPSALDFFAQVLKP
jgi:hypothetical protein